jgi:peptidoglycan/LPS O-acetylase OafA/YrhL
VILTHFLRVYVPSAAGSVSWWPVSHYAALGSASVSLFYILSGFVLAYVYLRPADPSVAMVTDRRTFWVARFARVYPAYALALAIQAPFVVAHQLSRHGATAGMAARLLITTGANVAMLQAWAPVLRGDWNSPGWSLSAEAFFYLSFPFIGPALWRLRGRTAIAVAAALVFASIGCFATVQFCLSPDRAAGLRTAVLQTPILRLPEFALGVLTCRAYLALAAAPDGGRRAGLAAGWLATAALLAAWVVANHIPPILLDVVLDPAFATALVALALARGPVARAASGRLPVLLGEASYGMYIFHVPLLLWYQKSTVPGRAFSAYWADAPHDEPVRFALYVAAVIGFSVGSFVWVEEPVRRAIRRRLARPIGQRPVAERSPVVAQP